MGVRQRVEHLHRDMGGLRRRERPQAVAEIVNRLAAHELHHHEQLVVLTVQLVDGGDAGMAQTRERDRFTAEALEDVRVAQFGIEDLDGDVAVERLVDGLVDRSHASAPEAIDDAVFAEGFSEHGRGARQSV